jgi:two-component system, OmpR family, phosphate regulon response regulator OmpR
MTSSPRILVLDDDAELRALLERYLSGNGFTVRAVADAEQLYRLLSRERFDALVLDVSMPGEDGLAVCARLRALGEWLPIVMLTARDDLISKVVGLEMGADDYMSKPFEPRELFARLNAQLRRRTVDKTRGASGRETQIGTWSFETHEGRLSRGEELITLKTSEAALLRALAGQPNRPLGRERLIEMARGPSVDLSDRTIDVQIMRLRRIVELDPSRPRLLQTVWGVGYMFVPAPTR